MKLYENKLKAFSYKRGVTRIKFKDHKIELLGFHHLSASPNEISLTMDIDDRGLHIPLTLEESENLLNKLTDSIKKLKERQEEQRIDFIQSIQMI